MRFFKTGMGGGGGGAVGSPFKVAVEKIAVGKVRGKSKLSSSSENSEEGQRQATEPARE